MTLFKRVDAPPGSIAVWNSYLKAFHFLQMDGITTAITTIDYAHHEVHAGSHFLYTDHVAIDADGSQDYLITTPNTTKWAHMMFVLDGSAITQFQLYEGATKTGTTPQTAGNSDRNSTTLPGITIHKGTSSEEGEADGTLIHIYKGGATSQQSRSGSSTSHEEELILKQNTKYILRVTSGTNANLTNVHLSWYEHVNLT